MTSKSEQTGVGRTTRGFFYLCAAACLGFAFWAAYSPLDIVSDAVGEVVPSSKVKRVQHLEGGIVHTIHVREGDPVSEGQPLLELEATASDSSVAELTVRISSLTAEVARLEAESGWFSDENIDPNTLELSLPAEMEVQSPDLARQAKELYAARRDRLMGDIKTEEQRVEQRTRDIEEISARIKSQRKNLEYVREQITISEDLLKDGLTTRYKHLGFLKEESSLASSIEEDRAALASARSGLVAARELAARVRNNFLEEVQENLRQSRRELLEFSQRLRKMSDSLSRTVLRAPADGIVKSLYVTGEGEVAQPGMTLLDIVPAGDKLVIEAHLPLGDVGYVQAGQPAMVKLATVDARMFGNLDGVVKHISPDAITKPEEGTYYRVLVETDRDRFEKDGRRYQLYPGMRVLVGIKTGERTVLEYLLYPYFDTLYQGMRER